MPAYSQKTADAIAKSGIPMSADYGTERPGQAGDSTIKARLLAKRRLRLGRNGSLGPTVEALHGVADLLESERWQRRHLGIHTTDYLLLMRVCYGPLLVWNERQARFDLLSRRLRPAGALEAARTVTAAVVAALGGESGATADEVRSAADRLALAAANGGRS